MSDHICDFVGHEQILVGQCPMTDSYLQPCTHVYWFKTVFLWSIETKGLAQDVEAIMAQAKRI